MEFYLYAQVLPGKASEKFLRPAASPWSPAGVGVYTSDPGWCSTWTPTAAAKPQATAEPVRQHRQPPATRIRGRYRARTSPAFSKAKKESKESTCACACACCSSDNFLMMERLQKLWSLTRKKFLLRAHWISRNGIRIGHYTGLTRTLWREKIYRTVSLSSFPEKDKKLKTMPDSFTSCMRWHVFHPSLSTFSWGAPDWTRLELNLRLWELWKRAHICA